MVKPRLIVTFSTFALLVPSLGHSQSTSEISVETVVVTGERIDRTIKETSSSVSVTSEEGLDALVAPDRIEQLFEVIPNVQVGAGDQGPSIRGQESTGVLQGADAFLGGTRPRATIQVDGRALGYNEFVYGLSSVWDVERVEVFRGPQTTTQGRNSIAGAIFVKTNDPTFDAESRLRLLAGDFDTRQVSAVTSGSLIDEQLAGRVAIDIRDQSTWVNFQGDDPLPADRTEDDYRLVRGKLLITPTQLPALRSTLTYSHLESRNLQGETIQAPFKKRQYDLAGGAGGYWKTRVDSLVSKTDVELDPAWRLSTTLTFGDSTISRLAPPGDGDAVVEATDVSIEAVAVFKPKDGSLEGLIGVYGLTAEQDEAIDLSLYLGVGDFRDEQTSGGLFGEGTWKATDRLAVTVGARYQTDSQVRAGSLASFNVNYDENFSAFLPKFSVGYDLTQAVRVGVLAQKGFNPGGTTISFNTGEQDFFDEETLWSYEVFLRSLLLDGKLQLNTNVFFTDYNDTQRPVTSVVERSDGTKELESSIGNAPGARSQGFEVEANWLVLSAVSLRGGVGILETEITKTTDSEDPILGNEFQRSPKFTAALGATWMPVESVKIDLSMHHHSDYFSDDTNVAEFKVGSGTIANLQIAYEADPYRLFAYVRNITDEFETTQIYSAELAAANDPRKIGAGVEVTF